ncbi:MAG: helix-turn-helix transcriptional regulator, partial [bacterium]
MHNDWAYFSIAESRLLGDHMAAARRAAGISAVSLARRLRIPEATLDAYEAGRERLPVPLLFGAARALRVAPYQLLAGRPDRVLN